MINAQSYVIDIDDPQIKFNSFEVANLFPKLIISFVLCHQGKRFVNCHLLINTFVVLLNTYLIFFVSCCLEASILPNKILWSCLAFIGSCNSTRKLVCRFLGVSSIDEISSLKVNGESQDKETFFTTYENVQIDTDINGASQYSLQSQVDK